MRRLTNLKTNKLWRIPLQISKEMKVMDKFFRKLEKELINELKIKGDYITLKELKIGDKGLLNGKRTK